MHDTRLGGGLEWEVLHVGAPVILCVCVYICVCVRLPQLVAMCPGLGDSQS